MFKTLHARQQWDALPFFVAAIFLLPCARLTLAFKPITHVYLSDVARQDAIDDGRVTIYETDYQSGKVRADANGDPVVIGEYRVDDRILTALRNAPAQYRAGVIGPDGYPDMLTGQQLVHPAGKITPGENDDSLNPGGPGPNPWLEHLWDVAFVSGKEADQTDKTRAFVIGYLTHAAGDMYSHTFVNYYTCGAFHFHPSPENAIKHILLEGYVAKRTPDPVFSASIDGVSGFIYRHMTFGKKGSRLESQLLQGDNTKFSVPAVYSRKYNWLTRDIDKYEKKLQELNDKIDDLEWYEATEHARLNLLKVNHRAQNQLRIDYYKKWREDIADRLKRWPGVNHKVVVALMFNADRKTDLEAAKGVLERYSRDHLLSMSGAPDLLGNVTGFVQDWIDAVISGLGIPAIKEEIDRMKTRLYDHILDKAIGITGTELKRYLQDPVNQFDPVMDTRAFGNEAKRINRADFDRLELRLTGEFFEHSRWPVAYNTIVMTKLLFLPKSEVNRLMRDLGSQQQMSSDNAMLGYCETLDGQNQWKANENKMVVARDDAAYRKIFMLQTGEDPTRGRWSLGVRYALGRTGARIIYVQEGGPADMAGLIVDDVITDIDSASISNAANRPTVLRDTLNSSVNGIVLLRYLRGGSTHLVNVTLKERP